MAGFVCVICCATYVCGASRQFFQVTRRARKLLAEISTWRRRASEILAELAEFPASRKNLRRHLGMASASRKILA